jgi:transcriptional regulator with XRE-family HTH domain
MTSDKNTFPPDEASLGNITNPALSNKQKLLPFYQAFDRDLRRAGLTQTDLANKMQVSQQSVSKWRVKNFLPLQQQERLSKLLEALTGNASYVYQYFNNGQLEQVMGPAILDDYADLYNGDWAHQTTAQHLVSVRKQPRNSATLETDERTISSRRSPDNESFERHNAWLSEVARQFNGIETHHLYQDYLGVKAVFDVAIPKLRTYITCVGTFAGHKPVRDLLSYSPQLVKLCAMYLNSAKPQKNITYDRPIEVVVLHGIFGDKKPTANEFEIKKWLAHIGISMLHVHDYHEALVAMSHLCHQPESLKVAE